MINDTITLDNLQIIFLHFYVFSGLVCWQNLVLWRIKLDIVSSSRGRALASIRLDTRVNFYGLGFGHSLANRHSCSTAAETQDRKCFSMCLIFSQPSIYIDGWLYGMRMTSVTFQCCLKTIPHIIILSSRHESDIPSLPGR